MLPTNRGKARLSCVKAPNYGCELSNQSFVYDSVKLELILGQEKTFFFFPSDLECISQTAFNHWCLLQLRARFGKFWHILSGAPQTEECRAVLRGCSAWALGKRQRQAGIPFLLGVGGLCCWLAGNRAQPLGSAALLQH